MASAAGSNLVRWRPAIVAVTVLSAGLTLYHFRDALWRARHEPSPQLHRSNAIHRRSRQQGRGRNSTHQTDLAVTISAEELTWMFLEGPDTFGYEGHILRLPGQADYISVNRSNLRTLTRTLISLSSEEAKTLRASFEETLVVAFLCARMPNNSLLKDPEGWKAYERALEREGFNCMDIVSDILTAWNLGKFDEATERLRFYERNNISPNAARRYLRQPPEGSEIDLLMDDTNQQRHSSDRLEEQTVFSELEYDEYDESSSSWGGEDDESKKDGQTLLNMLYHIAEDQSRQYGYIHRGVSCNSCNMLPIRGIRYRCSNCPDYDLCEHCEALQVHPKTHLLYKIRVPAPFFDHSQRPQAPRYPGKLNGLPSHLPRQVSKKLSQQSGRELPEIEALWDTFKCLATVEWPSDPLEFGVAIDRDCFDLCFLASTANSRKPPNMPMHDRIFAFFDSNNDNLIGFEEFVTGVATIRTKDRTVRLKRTFWVYDFDGDNYVCRNDFLFMFRSYYALSKELTFDMIQNLQYDVLEGPNPQDIILGTQPISAAYNGSIPQPHSRKYREGKELNLEGERVVVDGGGVISEQDNDLADYWDIIADASEKAAFGKLIDLPALETFYRYEVGEPGAANDSHPLLNEEWCPDFVKHDDIVKALDRNVRPDEVNDLLDRRKCIKLAIRRRHEAREAGVKLRRERSLYYDPRPTKPYQSIQGSKSGEEPQLIDSHAPEEISTRSSDNQFRAERIEPRLEDDIGQEYLFQMLQEGLNELLDPLFRQREELAILARNTRDIREKIHDQLFAFATPEMRRLCTHQVNTLDVLSRAYQEKGVLGFQVDIGQELRKLISLQENEYHDEFVRNLKTMLKIGVIDEDEYEKRMEGAKVVTSGSDNEDNSDGKASLQSDPIDPGSPEEEIADAGIPLSDRIYELDPLEPVLSPTATLLNGHPPVPEPSQSRSRANSPQEQPSVSSPPLTDAIAAISNLETEIRHGVEEFDAADAMIEEFIASQPLEVLLSQSGYSTTEPPRRTTTETPPALVSTEASVPDSGWDPTLPQHRPDSTAGMADRSSTSLNHEPTLLEELTQREATQQELKYYLMLQCLEDEDNMRGGPGRLNLEEFEAIMNGPRGNRLNFTGMFFEMVNF